jgi:two-component system, chemotaxis family, chemotaxis protein CheV
MHLLIVEDLEPVRLLLESVLGEHDVTFAENGAQALALLEGERLPDLIVSDLNMPVMDGWRLRERIEADPRLAKIPFVVFSSSHDENPPPSALAVFAKSELNRLAQFLRALGASEAAPL